MSLSEYSALAIKKDDSIHKKIMQMIEKKEVPDEISTFFHEGECFRKEVETLNHRACILEYIKNKDDKACNVSAYYGYVDLLEYALKNGCLCDKETVSYAIKNGQINCLDYFRLNTELLNCKNTLSIEASVFGNLESLKYAHKNGFKWDKWIIFLSMTYDNFDCLKYAYENGCPWDEMSLEFIPDIGWEKYVKYARDNGCPWNEDVTAYAAKKGNFEYLKYLHENGCPWDYTTIIYCIISDNLEMLKYAHENGCPFQGNIQELEFYFENRIHSETFKYLKEQLIL